MSDLIKKKCVPCERGSKPLSGEEITKLKHEVSNWEVSSDNKSISRELAFKDFVEAVVFITDVAHIAEEEGHHPDMHLHNWNKVTLTLSTHAIGGLSENDFILASKIDEMRVQAGES